MLLKYKDQQKLFHIFELCVLTLYIQTGLIKSLKHINRKQILIYEGRFNLLAKYKDQYYENEEYKVWYDTIDRIISILVERNIGLIVHMIHKYYIHVYNRKDIYQEGIFAIIKCIYKFEYKRGLRFSTYLTWWARQIIGKASFEQTQAMTIPLYVLNKNRNVKQYPNIKQNYNLQYGLENKYTIGDTHKSEFSEIMNLDKDLLDAKMIGIFQNHFKPRNEYILRSFWGIHYQCKTIDQISQKLGIKPERVKQIIYNGLRKIKELMNLSLLDTPIPS